MSEHPTANDRVETSVQCIKCGYDLVGLEPTGVCPECGAPVEQTLQGTLITHARPEYLAKLHRGVYFVLANIILGILVGITSAVLGFAAPGDETLLLALQWTLAIAGLAIGALGLVGWWRLSTPDPDYTGKDEGRTPRVLIRATVVAYALLAVAGFAIGLPTAGAEPDDAIAPLVMVLGLVNLLVFAVQFFASMLYVRWLGQRVPSTRIVKRASRLMWLGPLLYTVGALIVIGPLIALVLYYNLLDWLRKDLKAIRARQAAAA